MVYWWKGWRVDAYAADIVDISLLQPLSLLGNIRYRLIIHLHPLNDLALNVSNEVVPDHSLHQENDKLLMALICLGTVLILSGTLYWS